MESIKQKPLPPGLHRARPDFRNLGVLLRVLLLVNLCGAVTVLIQQHDLAQLKAALLTFAGELELPLYRREDSAGWTGRLSERLKQKFGTASIFMDIDTIQPGTDFAKALRSAVGSYDVLLAMIGPNWPIATSPEGQRRLEDPNDWVRTELTAALKRSIPVIPVLVGGADLPKVDTLPDELKKLFQYQTHELTDKRWEYDSSQLELVLEKVLGGGKPKRNVKQTLLAHRGALVALGIVGIGLAVALISPVARWSTQGTGIAQTNGSGIVTERNTPSIPSPEPVAQLNPTGLLPRFRQRPPENLHPRNRFPSPTNRNPRRLLHPFG